MECAKLGHSVHLAPVNPFRARRDFTVLKMPLTAQRDPVRLVIIVMAALLMRGQSTNLMAIYVPLVISVNLEVMHRMPAGLVNLQGVMVTTIAMHVYHVSSLRLKFLIVTY